MAANTIEQIKIEGFKSFGSPGRPIQLSPFSFLVGANASGKSNFVSAFRFLQTSLLRGLDHAVLDLGGCREVRNRILREREQSLLRCRAYSSRKERRRSSLRPLLRSPLDSAAQDRR